MSSQNGLQPIGLPTWRVDAISRVVAVYDDPELAGNDPMVRVKRGASDMERLNSLLELCDELYPEASSLIRSSKAAPKTRLAIVLGRLDEISLEGRTFKAVNATSYNWVDAEDEGKEKEPKPAKAPPKPRSKGESSVKVNDAAIKKIMEQEAKKDAAKPPAPKPKPTSRNTKPKTQVKPSRAAKTTRARTAAK